MKHFVGNDLFYQKQSGFRHTALTEVIDTWLSEINISKLCGALLIDFAKAFDVINHDLLLRKPSTAYQRTPLVLFAPSSTAASKMFP